MATIVNFGTEVIHRYVLELRYEFGQVYWDRAGRIARQLISENENWDFDEIALNRCQLSQRDQNLIFNFGPGKLDLTQTQTSEVSNLLPFGEFGTLAEVLASSVIKTLEIDSFPRIGFRVWHLYPTAGHEQSAELLQNLNGFQLESEFAKSCGKVTEVSYRLVVDRQQHMLRVAVAPFEQQVEIPPSVIRAAKAKAKTKAYKQPSDQRKQTLLDKAKAERAIASFPQFGLLLDLDAFIEDPPYPNGLSISDFIKQASDDFQRLKPLVFATKK